MGWDSLMPSVPEPPSKAKQVPGRAPGVIAIRGDIFWYKSGTFQIESIGELLFIPWLVCS